MANRYLYPVPLFADLDMAWMERANCRGENKELFFPGPGNSAGRAKAICAKCAVREQCLDYALAQDEHVGVWGGKSERQRKELRRERRLP